MLTGDVENRSKNSVIDTDVYARILDASGEPVLPNRTRVGSIGDVNPGHSPFALNLSAGRNPRAVCDQKSPCPWIQCSGPQPR